MLRWELERHGLNAHIHHKKPLLTPIHKRKQRQWALAHGLWQKENWRAVWYSDELKFNLFGSDGREWCWTRAGEAFKKTVKHGGGSVMVWGCITPYGVGHLHHINRIMDAGKYITILNNNLLGTVCDYSVRPQAIYFQQDDDPKHTLKLAKAWFTSHHIDVLAWLPNSPNINIIENLWSHLEWMVHARNPLPRNRNELWEALQEEWMRIDMDYITCLYDSIPDRVDAI